MSENKPTQMNANGVNTEPEVSETQPSVFWLLFVIFVNLIIAVSLIFLKYVVELDLPGWLSWAATNSTLVSMILMVVSFGLYAVLNKSDCSTIEETKDRNLKTSLMKFFGKEDKFKYTGKRLISDLRGFGGSLIFAVFSYLSIYFLDDLYLSLTVTFIGCCFLLLSIMNLSIGVFKHFNQ
jgi:hypothetical protein